MNKGNKSVRIKKMDSMNKRIFFMAIIMIFCMSIFGACVNHTKDDELDGTNAEEAFSDETKNNITDEPESSQEFEIFGEDDLENETSSQHDFINEEGFMLESRILTPEGYERTEAEQDSFAQFLRNFPIKENDAKVYLYDGREKFNQNAHIAVFDLPIENYDLQQCADSVIRMYAEYFYATKQIDRIKFHFTNGFLAEYSRWMNGERIRVDGNDVSWVASKGYDDSYECFVEYLKNVFTYAGTLSMNSEATDIDLSEACAGDVFLYGGSPGHVVMIVDVCVNDNGEKAFLLAQGYMPAQEFHILVNERHREDPWYYEAEITYPFSTPEYVFDEGSLKRLNY